MRYKVGKLEGHYITVRLYSPYSDNYRDCLFSPSDFDSVKIGHFNNITLYSGPVYKTNASIAWVQHAIWDIIENPEPVLRAIQEQINAR